MYKLYFWNTTFFQVNSWNQNELVCLTTSIQIREDKIQIQYKLQFLSFKLQFSYFDISFILYLYGQSVFTNV